MTEKRFGALSSSVDPSQLSKSVESLLKIIGGVLVFFGIASVEEIQAILGQVGTLVPAVYVVWNFAELIFGLGRKILVRIADKG